MNLFNLSLHKTLLQLLPPDYKERRGLNHLYVWKDIPYWMVVDEEFSEFLTELTSVKTLNDIFAKHPEWNTARKNILTGTKKLLELRVIQKTSESKLKPPPASDIAPIENIALNITMHCNLRCTHCYNKNLLHKNSGELSSDEIINFLKSAKKILSKSPSLTILGGEPLLYPDKLLSVARYAVKNGFNAIVSTNGTLITEKIAAEIRKAGLHVQVSVDGHNAPMNDAVRGIGVFDKLKKGIEILARNRVYTIISMVCHEGNIDYLERFYLFARSTGANEVRAIPLKCMGGALNGKIRPVNLHTLLQRTCDILIRFPELAGMLGRDFFSITANTCMHSVKRASCGTGLQTLLLDSDGSIYPCLNTNAPEFRIANVRDNDFSLADTWKTSTALNKIRSLSRIDTINATCGSCEVKHWCLAGCRGETYANTGSFNAMPSNCGDLKQTIIKMFWILSENPAIIKPMARIC
ncbi:MAG: radical SAM protein [Planctomycetes bacterium]|nr:radical SAM protein [Planctomycetota bacterium]